MVGGLQSARSVLHLAQTVRLADRAGLLPDAALAARRLGAFLETAGVPQKGALLTDRSRKWPVPSLANN